MNIKVTKLSFLSRVKIFLYQFRFILEVLFQKKHSVSLGEIDKLCPPSPGGGVYERAAFANTINAESLSLTSPWDERYRSWGGSDTQVYIDEVRADDIQGISFAREINGARGTLLRTLFLGEFFSFLDGKEHEIYIVGNNEFGFHRAIHLAKVKFVRENFGIAVDDISLSLSYTFKAAAVEWLDYPDFLVKATGERIAKQVAEQAKATS